MPTPATQMSKQRTGPHTLDTLTQARVERYSRAHPQTTGTEHTRTHHRCAHSAPLCPQQEQRHSVPAPTRNHSQTRNPVHTYRWLLRGSHIDMWCLLLLSLLGKKNGQVQCTPTSKIDREPHGHLTISRERYRDPNAPARSPCACCPLWAPDLRLPEGVTRFPAVREHVGLNFEAYMQGCKGSTPCFTE